MIISRNKRLECVDLQNIIFWSAQKNKKKSIGKTSENVKKWWLCNMKD